MKVDDFRVEKRLKKQTFFCGSELSSLFFPVSRLHVGERLVRRAQSKWSKGESDFVCRSHRLHGRKLGAESVRRVETNIRGC